MRADASTLHRADLPTVAAIHRLEVTRPAVVLGSTQPDDVVDVGAVHARRADLVRRRSGGGVVVLGRDDHLWVDMVVPRDHALWHEDVARAAWWVGEAWCEALHAAGVRGDLAVHRGGAQLPAAERILCFFDLGAGEVTHDGRKLVGIAQRRSRHAARFQCVVYERFDAAEHLAVLRRPVPWPATQAATDLRAAGPGVDSVVHAVWQNLRRIVVDRLGSGDDGGWGGEKWGEMVDSGG